MSLFNLICLALSGIIYLIIGARLLWLSRRTRGAPEMLWGLAWFFAAVQAGADFLSKTVDADTVVYRTLCWTADTAYPIVVIVIFLALWRLFRSQERWAKGVAVGVGVVTLGVFIYQSVGLGLDVHFMGTGRPLQGWWIDVAMTAGLSWVALDSGRFFLMYRRRWQIGLAPRTTSFRYLMWCGSACALLWFWAVVWTDLVAGVPMWLLFSTLSVMSLVSVSMMWITFFPPAWLCSRLEQEASA